MQRSNIKHPALLATLLALAPCLSNQAATNLPTPTPQQKAWQQLEFIGFAHFGINTFTDQEWGDGQEDPRLFNPTAFNANQWAETLNAAGIKLLILTAKHHDGFCLWPSAYTEHSVKNSPWRNGRGDVVREVTDALRKHNIRVGLYLSPWDRNQPTYGDSPRYNQFFLNQLKELLTNYGPVDEVWFDGACGEGPNGLQQNYDWPSYYTLIRQLQPHALIAICGPDIRWVGNESGVARENESSVVLRDNQPAWHPAECDVSIRPGWFYHPAQDGLVKPLETLADIYFKSVGRNSVLLLNIPPNREGLIAAPDASRLREFGSFIQQLYARDFIQDATIKTPQLPPTQAASNPIADKNLNTSWTPTGDTPYTLDFDLGTQKAFNVARLQEDITHGERVQAYHIEVQAHGQWKTITSGNVVGHKQLRRFPTVTAQHVRLVIDQSIAPPALAEFGLHFNTLAPAGSGAASAHHPASASNTHPGGTQYGPDKAVDDDPATRWATSDDTQQAWLEVDLQQPTTISRIKISELDPRISRYTLECRLKDSDPWQVALEGTTAGTDFSTTFNPVQARYARLHILNSTRPPTIWEFQLFSK
ncbi:MAG: hypothetical protein RI897_1135 [Verrucomicrobiota bacterium]|jgi:alpha-L-fucosidase